MSSFDPETKANLAKEFVATEYGKYLISELLRRRDNHRDIADGADAHNIIVNHTKEACGINEALKVITDDARMADSPIFKKK